MIQYLFCHICTKVVSSPFTPEPTDLPDQGIIVRAFIQCPECLQKAWNKAMEPEVLLHQQRKESIQ